MANDDNALINMPKINYILIAVGSACIVVTIYHCITACCCSRRPRQAVNQPPPSDPQTTRSPTNIAHLVDEMIPARVYQKDEEFIGEGTCSVCLSEFEDGDRLRTLPECMHTFHAQCIDTWLCSQSSCPVCRAEASPAPFMCRNAPGFRSGEYGMLQDSGIPQSVVIQSARP